MNKKYSIVLLLIIAGACVLYLLLMQKQGTDEEIINGMVQDFAAYFADGELGSIKELLTEDFELTRKRNIMSKEELSKVLKFQFFRGNRILLSGRVERMEFNEEKTRAEVVWEGKVRMKGRSENWTDSGTGHLVFTRRSGGWLLRKAVAF